MLTPRKSTWSMLVIGTIILAIVPAAEIRAGDKVKDIVSKLAKPIDLDKGIDKDTPLKDALEFLAEKYALTILIDSQAFKGDPQLKEPIENAPVRMPKMMGVRSGTVLRLLLSQVNATALVRGDYVKVVPTQRVIHDIYQGREPPYFPLVHIALEGRPLKEAVRELTAASGVSIVVDNRCEQSADPLTATLINVPLDAAVRVLADMAGLKVVHLDNVLYVTSKENAEALRAERDGRPSGKPTSMKIEAIRDAPGK